MKCSKKITRKFKPFATAAQECQNESVYGQDMCMVHIELEDLHSRLRKIEERLTPSRSITIGVE